MNNRKQKIHKIIVKSLKESKNIRKGNPMLTAKSSFK